MRRASGAELPAHFPTLVGVHVHVEVALLQIFQLLFRELAARRHGVGIAVLVERNDDRPVLPLAPRWMCAIVPCTSFVVTLPVIVPSSATRKLPEPEPGVLTGGTSSAPESFTLIAPLPGIQAGTVSR